MTHPWHGIFSVLLTPFVTDRSAIDDASLRREVDFVIDAGAHGIVTPVNTSEFYLLSDDERRHLAEIVLEQTHGRVPVVIGVAAPNPGTASQLAEHARQHGAAGVIAMPPYVGQANERALREYYAQIAAAADDLPIVVQNVGGEVGSPMRPEYVLELAEQIPSIRYVKEETTPSTHKITELLHLSAGRLDGVFGGSGGRFLVEELRRGACGLMSGCQLVDAQVRVYEAFQSGDEALARSVFQRQLPAQNQWGLLGLGFAKEILCRRGVFSSNVCRRPVTTLDSYDADELDWTLGLANADPRSLTVA
jgi:dihydrodipicolinate synthase/N-acetylneuraminate lyase